MDSPEAAPVRAILKAYEKMTPLLKTDLCEGLRSMRETLEEVDIPALIERGWYSTAARRIYFLRWLKDIEPKCP